MLQLTEKELYQARVLILLPLLAALIWTFAKRDVILPTSAVPDGKAQIILNRLQNPAPGSINTLQAGDYDPNHVNINSASRDQLLACPGIGKKLVDKILLERSYGVFADWRDLKDRVKGITQSKVEKLKDAGVKLNH